MLYCISLKEMLTVELVGSHLWGRQVSTIERDPLRMLQTKRLRIDKKSNISMKNL